MSRPSYIIEVRPLCPKCLEALPKPDYWLKLDPAERIAGHQVFCPRCLHIVNARFYESRGDY